MLKETSSFSQKDQRSNTFTQTKGIMVEKKLNNLLLTSMGLEEFAKIVIKQNKQQQQPSASMEVNSSNLRDLAEVMYAIQLNKIRKRSTMDQQCNLKLSTNLSK